MIEFNQMQAFVQDPLIIAEAAGIGMPDTEGRWCIDGLSGIFAVSVGHGNAAVIDAIPRQHARVAYASPIMALTEPALDLAERLSTLSGGRAHAVKQYSAGSEATEATIKIARQFHHQNGEPRRLKIISLYRGLHGTTLGALAATGHPVLQTAFHPLGGGVVHTHPPIHHDWPGSPDGALCGEPCLALRRNTVSGEGPETVAAIMLESLMMSAGGYEQPPGFLVAVRELCDEVGALLIIDEVITGFGRLGAWFACDLHDVWPDLMAVGKGLSGGYAPLSSVLMTEEVTDRFWGDPADNRQFQDGHTYASNPVSAAVGLAVIDYIEREGLIEHLNVSGERFGDLLGQIAKRHSIVRDVGGKGFLWCIDFAPGEYSRRGAPSASLGSVLHQLAPKRGLLIRVSRTVAQIAPPLTTTNAELDEIAELLDAALGDLNGAIHAGKVARFAPAFSL